MEGTIETLYEDRPHLSRLGTEKFMLDGRHTGTGGGNHIVIGGATPADSPFLRRPDLLRSLITFWNNHPSLSFLFSGLFIGPTSQQPRMDEARHDSLYELEIAFAEMDRQTAGDQPCPPWLVDRLLRHLLVDVSGNTHRAEFCIDKLYSPDSSAGRLGPFGIPRLRDAAPCPDEPGSAAAPARCRGLVLENAFSPAPDALGHAVARSLHAAGNGTPGFHGRARILQAGRFSAEHGIFFHPHFEFRIPIYGRVVYQGMEMELRQALEPWHVLGEEAGGGAARPLCGFVRGTAAGHGFGHDRGPPHCGLQWPSGAPAAHRCGWGICPRHSLPGLAATLLPAPHHRRWHTPLTIDLFDTWSGRAVGGCAYHVGHPGGRHHETFPVNSWEAEGRRHARFVPGGHTPGAQVTIPAPESNPDFPYTLDLRR